MVRIQANYFVGNSWLGSSLKWAQNFFVLIFFKKFQNPLGSSFAEPLSEFESTSFDGTSIFKACVKKFSDVVKIEFGGDAEFAEETWGAKIGRNAELSPDKNEWNWPKFGRFGKFWRKILEFWPSSKDFGSIGLGIMTEEASVLRWKFEGFGECMNSDETDEPEPFENDEDGAEVSEGSEATAT